MTRPILEARGLTVRHGGVDALVDVDLALAEGEVLGLIGPNGAGKTTCLDVLTGFARPASGTVHLDGTPLDRLPAHRRAHLGLVRTFQALELFPDLTVREHVTLAASSASPATTTWRSSGLGAAGRSSRRPLGRTARADAPATGVPRTGAPAPAIAATDEPSIDLAVTGAVASGGPASRARAADGPGADAGSSGGPASWVPAADAPATGSVVDEVLDRLGLTAMAGRTPDRIPGDARRRLALARALAGRPRVLLLDEPSAGLSPGEAAAVAALVRGLADEGVAVLLVDHDVDLVASCADRLQVLDRGRTLAVGPVAEVRADPAVVAAYLGTER